MALQVDLAGAISLGAREAATIVLEILDNRASAMRRRIAINLDRETTATAATRGIRVAAVVAMRRIAAHVVAMREVAATAEAAVALGEESADDAVSYGT